MSRRKGIEGLLVDIRRAATPKGRIDVGCFVIEGTRLFERATRAKAEVTTAIHAEDFEQTSEPRSTEILNALRSTGTELFSMPRDKMTALTAGRGFGAIIGLVRLPDSACLATLLANCKEPARILVATDIEDPGNVGALMRTALASGATALVTTGVSDPYHPRAVRTSMGAVFRLPLLTERTSEVLTSMHDNGVQTIATVVGTGEDLREFSWPKSPVAILMGSEAHALPADVIECANHRVSIPMKGVVDSYSVNAAASIVLYDAMNSA